MDVETDVIGRDARRRRIGAQYEFWQVARDDPKLRLTGDFPGNLYGEVVNERANSRH
ncbi:hypothetical protein ACX3OZ_10720 [Devosia sp. A369]